MAAGADVFARGGRSGGWHPSELYGGFPLHHDDIVLGYLAPAHAICDGGEGASTMPFALGWAAGRAVRTCYQYHAIHGEDRPRGCSGEHLPRGAVVTAIAGGVTD